MSDKHFKKISRFLDKVAVDVTIWVGSVQSLIIHTIVFSSFFLLKLVGVSLDTILLALTTVVSLEAIYLAILIQMTVNKEGDATRELDKNLQHIHKELGHLGDHVEDLSETIEGKDESYNIFE